MGLRGSIRLLHILGNTICYHASLILPFVIVGLLAYINFKTDHPLIFMITLIWIILLLAVALLYSSALVSKIFFERELTRLARRKLIPITSLRGIDTVRKSITKNLNFIFISLILVGIAFISYVESLLGMVPLLYVAVGLALVAFGMVLFARRPKVPVVDIGGLIEFYNPVEFKVYVDNMLQDTLPSVLDPLSYLKFDDWIDYIGNYLSVPPGINKRTIIERAVEKILLMALLHVRFPKEITEDVLYSEIAELLSKPDDIEKLLKPQAPGIYSLEDLKRFMRRYADLAPELVLTIERIFLTLRDNLVKFKESELYFDVVTPERTRGLSGISMFIFLFNNSDEYKEKVWPIRVHVIAPSFEPDRITLDVRLDPKGDFRIMSDKLEPYVKEGEDVVGKLSEILQIGDGIWLRLKPVNYGLRTITILVEDGGTILASKQLNVLVKRDFLGFFRKIFGSGSMLGGAFTLISRLLVH